jgi:hypothetical protein
MAATSHSPPGAHGCHTETAEPRGECTYCSRLADPACYCCARSGRLDIQAAIARTAEDWARRWGME